MEDPKKKYLTPEEYLAAEAVSEIKHDYYQGEIFAFAGATVNHNQIVSNLSAALHGAFQNRNCRVFSNDMRLWINSQNLFTYPDIVAICGKLEFYENRNDTITNPHLIAEVLSESTQDYDRGQKFMFYRAIESLREYLVIDQYSIHVEHYSKGKDNHWVLTDYNNLEDTISIPAIDFSISLTDIYDKVEFPKK